MDDLLKILVPVGFFIFWVVTKLSERNVKPLELKGSPPPYKPVAPQRPQPQPQAVQATRAPMLRWSNQVGGEPSNLTRDEEIIILGSETRPVRPGSVPTVRRQPNRGRSGNAPANRPVPVAPKPAKSKRLVEVSLGVSQSLNENLSRRHLTDSTPTTRISSFAAPVKSEAATARGVAIRMLLKDPERVREAIIINEILQPPVSLRRPRGF